MKVEKIINSLQEKNFKRYEFEKNIMGQLEEHNITSWANSSRIVMLKEYRTEKSLLEWNKNDQTCIASILYCVPPKCINNLYFFIILNFNSNEIGLRLEINKIEKNELICKKYVLKNEKDLNRIPFLTNVTLKSDSFAFDEKFKKSIMEFNNSVNVDEESQRINIEAVMIDYFKRYLNDKINFNAKLEHLLRIGD